MADFTEELLESIALSGPIVGAAPVRAPQKQIAPQVDGTSPIAALRARHHQLARLLAEGKDNIEASYLTGYAPQTISSLKRDPAFNELVEYYRAQVDVQYLDMHAKLGSLAATAVDILHERLEEHPEKFTNEDLRKIVDSASERTIGPKLPANGSGGIQVNVNFVGKGGDSAPVIDISPSGSETH